MHDEPQNNLPTDVLRVGELRRALASLDVNPSKSLGQNFLIDRNILRILVAAADIHAGETVLEVGPGAGALTGALLHAGARVIAIEKDGRLFRFLQGQFGNRADLLLVHADMLRVDRQALRWPDGSVVHIDKLVANLPYVVGSRVLADCFRDTPPVRIVATLQREVVARLGALPGSPAYGLLSIWAQRRYRVRQEHIVAAGCFYPEPDVSSAIVKLTRHGEPDDPALTQVLFAATRRAFAQRRKQLASTLADFEAPGKPGRDRLAVLLESLGLPAAARPEALDWRQWDAVAGLLRAH